MKKLERKWARICFVLLVAAIVCIAAPWLMEALFDAESPAIPITFGVLTLILIGLELLFSHKHLRCSHCGKSTAPPRWNSRHRYRCSRCASIFVFDDEEEPESPAVEEYDEDDEDEWEEYDGGEDEQYDASEEPEEPQLKEEE